MNEKSIEQLQEEHDELVRNIQGDRDKRKDWWYKYTRGSTQIPNLDEKYQKIFGKKTDGVFFEVGGFDGISASNTVALADLGWEGYFVEPCRRWAAFCRENHQNNKKITVIKKACSNFEGTTKLWTKDAASTIAESHKEACNNMGKGGWNKSQEVSVTKLNTLLEEYNVIPGFDMLVVDVEGSEPEVFECFDIDKWVPKVMIIELIDFHPDFVRKAPAEVERCKILRKHICDHGYEEFEVNAINTIFVKK